MEPVSKPTPTPTDNHVGEIVTGKILVSKYIPNRGIITLDKPVGGIRFCAVLADTIYRGDVPLTDGLHVTGVIKYATPNAFVFDEYWNTTTEKKSFWSKIFRKR